MFSCGGERVCEERGMRSHAEMNVVAHECKCTFVIPCILMVCISELVDSMCVDDVDASAMYIQVIFVQGTCINHFITLFHVQTGGIRMNQWLVLD